MILVIGSIIRRDKPSRSLEVLFDLTINFLISASVAKVKVFIKQFMSNEGCTLSSGNFERIIVILSTKKFEKFSQIVLSDRFSGKEGS